MSHTLDQDGDSSSSDEVPLSHLLTPEGKQGESLGGPYKTPSMAPYRISDRIRSRQSKKFTMPTRREIFDKMDIPSNLNSSSYKHLKPRKIVNDFIKVNHRYNFDPDYTSGEDSSMDGFLDLSENESSSEDEGEEEKLNHQNVSDKTDKNSKLSKKNGQETREMSMISYGEGNSRFKRIKRISSDSSDGENNEDRDSDIAVPVRKKNCKSALQHTQFQTL